MSVVSRHMSAEGGPDYSALYDELTQAGVDVYDLGEKAYGFSRDEIDAQLEQNRIGKFKDFYSMMDQFNQDQSYDDQEVAQVLDYMDRFQMTPAQIARATNGAYTEQGVTDWLTANRSGIDPIGPEFGINPPPLADPWFGENPPPGDLGPFELDYMTRPAFGLDQTIGDPNAEAMLNGGGPQNPDTAALQQAAADAVNQAGQQGQMQSLVDRYMADQSVDNERAVYDAMGQYAISPDQLAGMTGGAFTADDATS